MVNKWLKGLVWLATSLLVLIKRLVVESLSDIETSIFKALLTYHFLIFFGKGSMMVSTPLHQFQKIHLCGLSD